MTPYLKQGDLVHGNILLLNQLENGLPDLVLELVDLHHEVDDELPHHIRVIGKRVRLVEGMAIVFQVGLDLRVPGIVEGLLVLGVGNVEAVGAVASPQQQLDGLQMGVRGCDVQGGVPFTVLGCEVNSRLRTHKERKKKK